jgi:hypothetical protein
MFRADVLKIVLQHNLPNPNIHKKSRRLGRGFLIEAFNRPSKRVRTVTNQPAMTRHINASAVLLRAEAARQHNFRC